MWRAAVEARSAESGPLVTWRTGDQRVELSGRSLANAVFKAANLLVDEVGVEPGSLVAVRLGCHWQSAVWHAATLLAGTTVCDEQLADVLIAFADEVAPQQPGVPHQLAVSRHPLGLPDREVPLGWDNASAMVAGQPDVFLGVGQVADQVWVGADGQVRASDLAAAAAQALPPGHGRVAVVGVPSGRDALVLHAAIPVLLDVPVLLTPHADAALLATEQASRIVACAVE